MIFRERFGFAFVSYLKPGTSLKQQELGLISREILVPRLIYHKICIDLQMCQMSVVVNLYEIIKITMDANAASSFNWHL